MPSATYGTSVSGKWFGMEPTTPDVMYEPSSLSNGNAGLWNFRGGGGGEGLAANYEVLSVVWLCIITAARVATVGNGGRHDMAHHTWHVALAMVQLSNVEI